MFGIKTKLIQFSNIYLGSQSHLNNIQIAPVRISCNHRCSMCWRLFLPLNEANKQRGLEKNDLNINEYLQLIKSLPKSVKHIDIVGGGEPLLYPNIGVLFRSIKEKNIHGTLITNGSLMDENIVHSLVSCGFDAIRISLHATTRETYKKIHGVDHFNLVLNNIKKCIYIRKTIKIPQIILYFLIQQDNLPEITRMPEFAQNLNADRIEFGGLIQYKKNMPGILTKTQYFQALTSLSKISTTKISNNIKDTIYSFKTNPNLGALIPVKKYFTQKKFCPVANSTLTIESNGLAYPCCIALGLIPGISIKNQNVKQIWKSYSQFRKNINRGYYYPFCYRFCTLV